MKVADFSTTGRVQYKPPVLDSIEPGKKTGCSENKRFETALEMDHIAPGEAGPSLEPSKTEKSPSPLRRGLEKTMKSEVDIQKRLQRVMRRGVGSLEELIEVQMSVYRYTQHVELMSKSVDRANQSLKQTLQTQL